MAKLALGIFWAIAVLGVFGGFLLWSAPENHAQEQQTARPPQAEQAETKPGKSEQNSGQRSGWAKYKEKIEENEKVITAVSTVFIAAFTIILAFATGFLYVATRNLVESADDTSQKQLRAYIGVFSNETTFYPFQGGGFAFIAHAELRNFGQTPAYDLTVETNAAIDVPTADPFHQKNIHQTAAGPNIAFRDAGVQINVGWQIPEADVIAVRDRTKNVFLWGTVHYRDVFKKPHYFTFRLINGQAMVGTQSVYVMAVHPLGNDAD